MVAALSLTFVSLLSLTILAVEGRVVTVESSGITLPIATHINVTGPATFVEMERLRAQSLIERGKAKARGVNAGAGIGVTVTNSLITYTLQVGVGTPATNYTLLIDTGSSNTWVGANKPYNPTSSSQDTGNKVSVTYGSGFFSGEEFTDTVDLGNGLVIQGQSIGVAHQSQGLTNMDGILGIGPVDLTSTSLSSGQQVPTVTDNLARAGTIPANSIGIFFAPTTLESDSNGELTFGGVDSTKVKGSVTFVPITSTSPASQFWGIDQTITYGYSGQTILSTTAGIVDTGTTLMLIATDAFQAYSNAVGAAVDPATGLLKIADPSTLQSLFYNIGDTTFEFTATAQQWPKALNSAIGGDPSSTYLIVADLGTNSGQGLDFINGYVWLERFYCVIDTDNQQVGIANTYN